MFIAYSVTERFAESAAFWRRTKSSCLNLRLSFSTEGFSTEVFSEAGFFAFGEDALTQPKKHPYAVCYNDPVFQMMTDSLLLQFKDHHTYAVYNYKQDPLLQKNIHSDCKTDTLDTYFKAYIQQYINRMITNQLTIHTNGCKSR